MDTLAVMSIAKDILIIVLGAGGGIKFAFDFKKSRNGNGIVTYKELSAHKESCGGTLHEKINEYHNTVLGEFRAFEGRVSRLEAQKN